MTKQDIFVIYVQTLVVVLSCMKESILQRGFVWSDVFITNLLSSRSAIVGLANVHAKKVRQAVPSGPVSSLNGLLISGIVCL